MTYLVLYVINRACHYFTVAAYVFFHSNFSICAWIDSQGVLCITCVGDGEASPQVTQGGAGAQPGFSGQGVAVVISLSAHCTHWLQAEDLSISWAHVARELQGGESGGVIHFDFKAGQGVQQGRGGHGDFVWAVVDPVLQGEEGSAEGPRCGSQIRRSGGMQRMRVICRHRRREELFSYRQKWHMQGWVC